jgi:hypothetical protein
VFVSFLLVRAKESVTLVEEMMPPSISRDRIAAPRANGSPCKVSGKTLAGGVARPLALQPNRSAIKCRNHDSESVCES